MRASEVSTEIDKLCDAFWAALCASGTQFSLGTQDDAHDVFLLVTESISRTVTNGARLV